MNNKKLGLGIIAVVILLLLVIYGGFYAFMSVVMVPEDVKLIKDELKSLENATFPESEIKEMETIANQIQNSPSLKQIPQSERTKMANDMRNDPTISSMNNTIKEIKENATVNRELAVRYDLIFKGNVANDLRSIYSQQLLDICQNMSNTIQKLPNDIENGDNTAIANDFRELAKLCKEYNIMIAQDKVKLQNMITNLGG